MLPLTDDSNLNAVFWAEFFFSFMMTFVAVMAILDPDFHHPLTPLVIGLTVTQGVLGKLIEVQISFANTYLRKGLA